MEGKIEIKIMYGIHFVPKKQIIKLYLQNKWYSLNKEKKDSVLIRIIDLFKGKQHSINKKKNNSVVIKIKDLRHVYGQISGYRDYYLLDKKNKILYIEDIEEMEHKIGINNCYE
jgi:hypothetical protein